MTLRKEQYRLRNGDDIGDPRTLNKRLFDVDLRLHQQEEIEKSWVSALDDLLSTGLERIDQVLAPAYNEIRELADLGAIFNATSATEVELSAGLKRLTVDEDQRNSYAPAAYVACYVDGNLGKAMLGQVVGYDRASGELEVIVDRFTGTGTGAGWIIHAASATDNAESAELALAAQLAAEQARSDTIGLRDYVDGRRDEVEAFHAAVALANASAIAAANDAEAAQAVIEAGLAAHSNYHLGALASDPATGPGGVPLVEGVRYFNTTDGAEKTYHNGGWVAAVVPVGSEVTQVFGRTGAVSAQAGDYDATKITFTPTGNIAATTVQAALAEVESDAAAALTSGLAGKANTSHTHTASQISDSTATGRSVLTAADAAAARTAIGSPATSHTHTASQISDSTATGRSVLTAADGAAARTAIGAADGNHTHTASQVSDSTVTGRAVLTAVDAAAARTAIGSPSTAHTHAIADVTNLQTTLNSKADTAHTHDDRYYTEAEITTLLAGKSDTSHNHSGVYLPVAGKASDSSLLNGAAENTAAVADTIVRRDASGHIAGNYLHGAYTSMSHGSATRSADTVFYSSTDDYIRKNTASGFRTSLDVYSKGEVNALPRGATALGAAVSMTSLSQHTFTGIPAGVSMVALSLHGLMSTGSNAYYIRIGDSGGIETTGYASVYCRPMEPAAPTSTSAILLRRGSSAFIDLRCVVYAVRHDGNKWLFRANVAEVDGGNIDPAFMAGWKELSAELTQIQLLNSSGNFDTGSARVFYW